MYQKRGVVIYEVTCFTCHVIKDTTVVSTSPDGVTIYEFNMRILI